MFALCIEASHKKGMGHLYRMLHFREYLNDAGEKSVVIINPDAKSCEFLNRKKIFFETASYNDFESGWETALINKYGIRVWVNDRLSTDIRHSLNVKKNQVKLVTFDDEGSGAAASDLHFAPLVLKKTGLKGGKIFSGPDYLILSKDILKYRRLRTSAEKIIVTLGGSDTYGTTIKIVKILKEAGKNACVIKGPMFQHDQELNSVINNDFTIKEAVKSLPEEFYSYDLAVTGGGITPFEANAAGLPCIIVANETFEVPRGEYLSKTGSSVYAGFRTRIRRPCFKKKLDIEKMSRLGIEKIPVNGSENIFMKIYNE